MADCVQRDPAAALCSSFIRNEAPSNAVEGEVIREVIAADSIAVITPHRAQRALLRTTLSEARFGSRMKLAVAPIEWGSRATKNP